MKDGNAGFKASRAGDLFISFRIMPDQHFKRDGQNILSQTEINMADAALGAKVEVETVDGPVILKIPEGTQSGKIFILKEKGVPELNRSNRRGDHLVEVIVRTPAKLSRRQKKLLEELKEELE